MVHHPHVTTVEAPPALRMFTPQPTPDQDMRATSSPLFKRLGLTGMENADSGTEDAKDGQLIWE